jgi:cation transport ATPase
MAQMAHSMGHGGGMTMDDMVRDMRKRFIILRPEIAAISMAGSSFLVAVNALLLKRTKLEGIRRYGAS